MQTQILLVDDEVDVLLLLKAKLSRAGYEVSTSLNAEHLLDNVIRLQPGLILMDISMQGVDGGSLCQLLKTSDCTQHIPVVLFSGNDNIHQVAAACKADAVLHKPYDRAAFDSMLKQFIA
ncbi:MAG: response regulator [Chitinophagaceae bacterium]